VTDSTDRVLASIDETIDGYVSEDWAVSGDAMRWQAEKPDNIRTVRYNVHVTSSMDAEAIARAFRPIGVMVQRQVESLREAFASLGKMINRSVEHVHTAIAPMHYGDDYRRHRRACRLCNPAGNPPPLLINGAEYRRRTRARRRRNRR
jgi:hypothetical protein